MYEGKYVGVMAELKYWKHGSYPLCEWSVVRYPSVQNPCTCVYSNINVCSWNVKKINTDDVNIYEIIFLHYSHQDQKNSEICIFCLLDGVACSELCSWTDVDNESCVWSDLWTTKIYTNQCCRSSAEVRLWQKAYESFISDWK